ncbi:unnamed protein product [Rhizophagus irregularis]|uniref:HMG box domain-containing protein n=1 Tax=Rhizophagus irregularis TaxID=588596 RepID=A0A2N1N0T6_9GLOM|nr:hypothetical protein RhiirC2_751662 [Rhizophagus irregularis]CAB4385956.1 unnamed protein product [Rhizophagus irregularis]CAB5315169.1 unnamed protein product [Rhizophagus irregularis]
MTNSIQEPKRNVRNTNTKKKSSKQNGKRKSSSKRKDPEITLNLPFPPNVKLEKFFPSKYTVSLRTLNAFIIYRKVVSAEIKKNKITLCWSKISTIASNKWKLEDAEVKQHYRDLAEKTKTLYRSKHLFYVHQGKNAASSVMLQDNGETTDNTPKTFTFVYSEYEKNLSNGSGVEQQKNAFNEQIEGTLETPEISNVDPHVLNESDQTIIPPSNTGFNLEHNFFNFVNMVGLPITTFLHDDRSFPLFQLEMANNNMPEFDDHRFI